MLENLNEKQREAVTSDSKYLRIIAGAGSGKTRVLTSRVAYLIQKKHVFPNKILAITFTNKAALEMKERVNKILGISPTYISTFHSFCVRVLREDIDKIGYRKSFTIIDEDDQNQIVKDIIKKNDYNLNVKDVVSYISYNKNSNIDPLEALAKPSFYQDNKKKAKVYQEYEERLKSSNSLDFDDLLLKTNHLFSLDKKVLEKWQNRFEHILVDEFQDTNDLQYDLVKSLVGKDNNLFVVGDPDQTIYTWRGANVNLILNFNHDYQEATTIILDKNYRSSQNILDASNKLINHNFKRVPKDLIALQEKGEEVVFKNFADANEEASWVANQIEYLHLKGVDYQDIAVLYRSNYLSRQIEISFMAHGIPYRIYGGLKFFERREIKDSLAYLRLKVNTDDDIAFLRIINSPKRSIGETTLNKIKEASYLSGKSIYEYLKNNRELIKTNKEKVNSSLDLFYRVMEEENSLDYALLLDNILTKVGYYDGIDEDDSKDDRIQNIKELMNGLMDYQNKTENPSLDDYLQQISLYSGQDEITSGEFVNLMTVHTAKGLEFDNVFIYGFSEGVFPSPRAIEESNDGIEEERRIAYVAVTRAKKRLFLTSNSGYSFASRMTCMPSRFIKEMDVYKKVLIEDGKVLKTNQGKPLTKVIYDPNQNSSIKWKKGDLVRHDTFGEGVIINVEDEMILTIIFKNKDVGQKILMGNHPALKKG